MHRTSMRYAFILFSLFTISFFPFSNCYCGYGGLPQMINAPGEKVVIVDPRLHAWGAYSPSGVLIRSGLATCGANWCKDMDSPCHTETGTFRVLHMGGANCKSPSFPIPKGGSPMPYCMYFNEAQALHGHYHVVNGNISHGCVRMSVGDAKWLHNNFVQRGTLVVVFPY